MGVHMRRMVVLEVMHSGGLVSVCCIDVFWSVDSSCLSLMNYRWREVTKLHPLLLWSVVERLNFNLCLLLFNILALRR